jgi:hypothetical protein
LLVSLFCETEIDCFVKSLRKERLRVTVCYVLFLFLSPVLAVLFLLLVLAILSWLYRPGFPVHTALYWLSCHSCPVPAALSWPSCPSCPVPAILSWLSCPGCPILAAVVKSLVGQSLSERFNTVPHQVVRLTKRKTGYDILFARLSKSVSC